MTPRGEGDEEAGQPSCCRGDASSSPATRPTVEVVRGSLLRSCHGRSRWTRVATSGSTAWRIRFRRPGHGDPPVQHDVDVGDVGTDLHPDHLAARQVGRHLAEHAGMQRGDTLGAEHRSRHQVGGFGRCRGLCGDGGPRREPAHWTRGGCEESSESSESPSDSRCTSWTVMLTSVTSRPVVRSNEAITLRRRRRPRRPRRCRRSWRPPGR